MESQVTILTKRVDQANEHKLIIVKDLEASDKEKNELRQEIKSLKAKIMTIDKAQFRASLITLIVLYTMMIL